MLTNDIRVSLRGLRKTPAFTVAVLMTIALGIGATTAIYSLVHTVLLRPLPLKDPDRLVRIAEKNPSLNLPDFAASALNFLSWRKESQSFEALAAVRTSSVNLTGNGEPERVLGSGVSDGFFGLMGIATVAGRTFSREEDVPGNDGVAILSEGLWRRRYGADPNIVGRAILVNGKSRIVVGVVPQDVGYTSRIGLWIPLALNPAEENRANHVVTVFGRLRKGMTVAAADAELNAVAERLEKEFPESNAGWRVVPMLLKQWVVGADSRRSLYLLFGAAGLLLLTTCANVAGLLVTRATGRAQEFGVRLALGAGYGRLVRQLVTESLLVALMGGLLGVVAASGAVRWLAAHVTNQLPRTANLVMDWPVLLFALALTVSVGVLFGLAPAWSARRSDVWAAVRQGQRGTTGNTVTPFGLALVGGQAAVATMLVVGALLLIQSFERLQKLDVGFQPDHVLTASINLPRAQYESQEQAEAFYKNLVAEIQSLPGVVSVGLTSGLPLAGGDTSMRVSPLERAAGVPEQGIQSSWRVADTGYFRAMHISLLRGQLFDESDPVAYVAVLSDGLARRLWPDGRNPVGQRVKLGNGEILTVAGVVGDVRMTDRRVVVPAIYFRAFLIPTLTLTIRTATPPEDLARALRDSVKRIDPSQPIFNVQTMVEVLDADAERARLQTTLLTAFACLALLLGAVGIAGVVGYSVESRGPELALRMVLGATPRVVMHSAARGGLAAALLGVASGLVGSLALSRSIASILFEVRPNDPRTFAVVGVVLIAIALLACWVPARRVIHIDPAAALKRD
jgi:putative ABC transport system permease protein